MSLHICLCIHTHTHTHTFIPHICGNYLHTRRNGSTTSDVFGKVTPVESIYLLLQNSRQTYAADYHDHALQTDAPLSAH